MGRFLVSTTLVATAIVAGAFAPFVVALRDAHADATSAPTKLLLRVEGNVAGATPESLRAAIAAELGVDVALTTSTDVDFAVTVRAEPGAVAMTFRAPDGRVIVRKIKAPKAKSSVETITLIVGNLVRDEAAELLGKLHAVAAVSVSASGSVLVGGDAIPPSASSKATAAPPASAAPLPATSATMPEVALAPAPRPLRPKVGAPIDPCDVERVGPWWGVDFVPRVGSSTTDEGARAVRVASFGVLGTWSGGVKGGELAGVAALTQGGVCGAQIAGVVAFSGGGMTGVQAGGVVSVSAGPVLGAQIAAVNVAVSGVAGAQLGAAQFATYVDGAQIGAFNFATRLRGLQMGGFELVDGDVAGTQIGAVNVVTGAMHGVQVGVVNYADEVEAPIGLVSVVPHGGVTSLDVFGSEDLTGEVALTHGGKLIHNVYGLGARPIHGGTAFAYTFGIGARLVSQPTFTLDLDILGTSLLARGLKTAYGTYVSRLRLLAGVRLGDTLVLTAGPSYSVLTTDDPEEASRHHAFDTHFTDGDHSVVGYPGATFGLRAEL